MKALFNMVAIATITLAETSLAQGGAFAPFMEDVTGNQTMAPFVTTYNVLELTRDMEIEGEMQQVPVGNLYANATHVDGEDLDGVRLKQTYVRLENGLVLSLGGELIFPDAAE